MATLTVSIDTECALQLLIDSIGAIEAMESANVERHHVEGGFRSVAFVLDAVASTLDADLFDGVYSKRYTLFEAVGDKAGE